MNGNGPQVRTDIPGPKSRELLRADQRHLSHGSAYGDMFGSGLHAPVFVASEGCYLIDADGNRFMDTSGAYSIGVQGYSPGPLIDAVCAQMRQLMHLPNMPNIPMLQLAESLLGICPGELKEGLVQFEVGGGPTMDLAFKLAYHHAVYGKGVSHPVTLAFMGAYHGRSIGANTLTGYAYYRDGMPRTPDVVHLPFAYCYRCPYEKEYPSCDILCARLVGKLLESSNYTFRDPNTGHNSVATLVIEPIQAHSGMIVPPDEFMPTLAEVCRQYGITTVVDEICMGIGHTGKWFACDHWGFVPDIMAVAKALTGGTWPLGAVVAKRPIYEVWGALPDRHMGTYHGSPVGCAAGLATLDLIKRENLLENASRMGAYFLAGLHELADRHSLIGEVCGKGLALGVEFVRDRTTKAPAAREAGLIVLEAAKKGVLILRNGYFNNRITFMPPLNVTKDEVDIILKVLDHAIRRVAL
ncbi:MAG: aspartate aminotransferase family protein [Bacillota bacterium]|nr:aspartate aminotransferase family protein [Bacillota bacterium]